MWFGQRGSVCQFAGMQRLHSYFSRLPDSCIRFDSVSLVWFGLVSVVQFVGMQTLQRLRDYFSGFSGLPDKCS